MRRFKSAGNGVTAAYTIAEVKPSASALENEVGKAET